MQTEARHYATEICCRKFFYLFSIGNWTLKYSLNPCQLTKSEPKAHQGREVFILTLDALVALIYIMKRV